MNVTELDSSSDSEGQASPAASKAFVVATLSTSKADVGKAKLVRYLEQHGGHAELIDGWTTVVRRRSINEHSTNNPKVGFQFRSDKGVLFRSKVAVGRHFGLQGPRQDSIAEQVGQRPIEMVLAPSGGLEERALAEGLELERSKSKSSSTGFKGVSFVRNPRAAPKGKPFQWNIRVGGYEADPAAAALQRARKARESTGGSAVQEEIATCGQLVDGRVLSDPLLANFITARQAALAAAGEAEALQQELTAAKASAPRKRELTETKRSLKNRQQELEALRTAIDEDTARLSTMRSARKRVKELKAAVSRAQDDAKRLKTEHMTAHSALVDC